MKTEREARDDERNSNKTEKWDVWGNNNNKLFSQCLLSSEQVGKHDKNKSN